MIIKFSGCNLNLSFINFRKQLETVLVTGGCGYIGSHTCVCLVKKGFNIVILDSLVNSYKSSYLKILEILRNEDKELINMIKFHEGDLRDMKFLGGIFAKQKKAGDPISSVIHFAGLKSIEESIKSPLEYWETNVVSTLSLLNVMAQYSCYSMIFSSSATVYKTSNSTLLNEDSYLKPSNPYGEKKLAIEIILRDLYLSNKEKWRISNLRYFNPVGVHESGLLGENPKGEAKNLFPNINKVIKKEKEKLLIFGNNWPTKDGTCIRDFIHVMDLAEAHVAALDYLLMNEPKILTLNIGTGKGTSVLEVMSTFEHLGTKIPHQFVDKRTGDIPFVVADNKLALKLLNWSPKRKLIQMCKDSLNNVLHE